MFLRFERFWLPAFLDSGLRQEELNAVQDIGEDKRFTEEGVGSRFQCREHQSWIGRDDEDCNPMRSLALTQLLNDLKPGHPWHLEIQKDQVIVILAV